MKIKRIINSVLSSNTFILTEDNSDFCWLIDVGDIEPIFQFIGNREIKGVFITHTHYDHIYGINKLVECFPKCIIYTSERGKEGLFSKKLNLSRYHGDSIIFIGKYVEVLDEGDEISLFPCIKLKVIYTPGHDWSSMCFYNEKVIFTGDSYIPGSKIITSLPKSNKDEAEISLRNILELTKTRDVYPGHLDCKFI